VWCVWSAAVFEVVIDGRYRGFGWEGNAGVYNVNFGKVFKVFDTVMSVLDATKEEPNNQPKTGERQTPASTLADQVEMRLTNVVVAALKEAFNRDEARLELERNHLEEQRRRAEGTMRMELRRQAADREIGRLKLLVGAGMVGWIASMVFLAVRSGGSHLSRGMLVAAAVLCLCSVGSAFMAQTRIGAYAITNDRPLQTSAAAVSLALILAGLAAAAFSVLL
jgi:hypothetical protein